MSEKKKETSAEQLAKDNNALVDEAVEKGYAYDALTDEQKASLDAEAETADDAEAFQAEDKEQGDEDGASQNYKDKRQQV